MDLEGVARVKATYDAADDATKALCVEYAREMRAAVERNLPALCSTDQAAVAWFTCVVLSAASERVAGGYDAVRLLNLSSSSYAMATVDLLGWGL